MKRNKKIILYIIVIILIVSIMLIMVLKNFYDDRDSRLYGTWDKEKTYFYTEDNLTYSEENISGFYVMIDKKNITFCGKSVCDEYSYSIEDNLFIINDFDGSELIYSYEFSDDDTLVLTNGYEQSNVVIYYKKNKS